MDGRRALDDAALDEATHLDLRADRAFERRWWRIQLAATVLFGALIVFGMAGLFGGGLWTQGVLADGGVTVRYERIARVRAPLMLEVELSATGMRPGATQVTLGTAMLKEMSIERIWPEPQTSVASSDGMQFTFATDPARAPARLIFHMRPAASGAIDGIIGVQGSESLRFRQLVLP